MKFGVWPDSRIQSIPRDTKELHLVRAIAIKKLQAICKKRAIQKISCSPSCFKRLKNKTKKWLEQKSISLEIQERRGRPLAISLKKMARIIELVKDHRSYREIEKTVQVPKSTVHYLVKYAHRDKIKQNGVTVFLK